MGEGLRLQTRRGLLQQMMPHYREALSVKKKSKLLDAFTATTEYKRVRHVASQPCARSATPT
jgi:hypothetical protein